MFKIKHNVVFIHASTYTTNNFKHINGLFALLTSIERSTYRTGEHFPINWTTYSSEENKLFFYLIRSRVFQYQIFFQFYTLLTLSLKNIVYK